MSYLQVNDVISFPAIGDGTAERRFAVLWLSPAGDQAVVIELSDAASLPQFQLSKELEEEIESGRATLGDPVLAAASCRAVLSEKEMNARDRRWKAIQEAVEDEPAIYTSAGRGAHLRSLVEQGYNKNSLLAWFQMHWRGGKTRNALVGNWSRCGAKGVERAECEKKLGRPREHGDETGLNLNRRMRAILRKVIWNLWRKNGRLRLSDAHEAFCRIVCYDEVYTDGKPLPEILLKPEFRTSGPPTIDQFKYHFYRYVDSLHLRRQKRRPRVFDLTQRGLPGSTTAETRGPGSRYVIDATILDVYCVSRINPKRIVGRPVLYIVRDVWSRLIVGIYVGIENASWVCAAMAIANVCEDKVEFCRRFGVEIDPDEWPNADIGDRLLHDGGEVAGAVAEAFAHYLNVILETARPYRGDDKSVAESAFQVLPAKMEPYVPGWVHPDFRQRGAEDYRLEAALTLEDITHICILGVLHRNNHVVLKGYDRDAGMPSQEVAPVASDLWRWGIANRSGRFRSFPPEFVRFRLMPEANAKIDEHGLKFRGTWYLSQEMLDRGWLERGRRKRFDVRISYDPRDANVVYLHMEGTLFGYEVCRINEAISRAYEGVSFWEIDAEEWDRKHTHALLRTKELTSSIQTTDRMSRVVDAAKERQGRPERETAGERLKQLRANKAVEREMQRAEDSFLFAPERPPEDAHAALPPPVEADGDDDYGVDIFDITQGGDRG
ncbi:MAG TPA: Mu transposase C-terminal domain-containing protein [Allosphingosinicella sp.]